jgi:hypothetical protein
MTYYGSEKVVPHYNVMVLRNVSKLPRGIWRTIWSAKIE